MRHLCNLNRWAKYSFSQGKTIPIPIYDNRDEAATNDGQDARVTRGRDARDTESDQEAYFLGFEIISHHVTS